MKAISFSRHNKVFSLFPLHIQKMISVLSGNILNELQEIRFRQCKPIALLSGQKEYFISKNGRLLSGVDDAAYCTSRDDINKIFQNLTKNSIYALEEELRSGYITVAGGHRVGFTGEAVIDGGKVRTLKNVMSINVRFCREIKGSADYLMPHLISSSAGTVYHTLIISPPKCGKTTLLRDLIRQVSSGNSSLNFAGVNVGIVDERSEIAACYRGEAQNDVGIRTDILDKCLKAEGMYMLVRAMSPDVIATDELGRSEDYNAVREVLNAGIKLITTVHGFDVKDVKLRPGLKELLDQNLFERIVILSRKKGAGTIEAVLDGCSGKNILINRTGKG